MNEENIDLESVEILPLLLQPFAENAILHGLRNKETNGKLQIKIFTQDEYLHICIEDNGIGRAKAKEMNGQVRKNHQSVGLGLTEKRLKDLFDEEEINPIELIDLADEQGNAIGTRVIVKIPY